VSLPEQTTTRRPDYVALVIALLLLLLAAVIAFDMSRLELAATYGLGPKAMPMVVAGALFLLAIGNAGIAFTTGLPKRAEVDPQAIALILGGFAILIALIGLGGGFIPATAILFAATARAFGRRTIVTDLAVGVVLGTVAYLMFDKVLSLSLPAGPVERLLSWSH
jgi:putative tricarboxylic transport membrane protein